MIKRDIYEKLKKYLNKKEIIVLVGSRQVGKTTLMQKLFDELSNSKKMFITFEDQIILNLFENKFDDFLNLYVKNNDYLFIDEIQNSKNSGQKLKLIYDTYNIKIIVSGSSAPELSIQSLSYLVGRVLVFEIFPLSFNEFINYKKKELLNIDKIDNLNISLFNQFFNEFIIYGGYPNVVYQNTNEEKEFILRNLVNTYLLKEIKDILLYKNSFEFENLLKFLATTDSTILNKSNISRDLNVYLAKINEMISVLEKTFIINIVRPIFNKKIKEIIKSPKTYFADLGFKNSLVNNFNSLELRVDKGAIVENFILSELVKQGIKVNFYNYRNQEEVDFIFEKDGKKIAIEVKSNLSGLKIEKSLKNYIEKFKPNIVYIFNLNQDGIIQIDDTKVIFLHHINVRNILDFL